MLFAEELTTGRNVFVLVRCSSWDQKAEVWPSHALLSVSGLIPEKSKPSNKRIRTAKVILIDETWRLSSKTYQSNQRKKT